MLTCPYIKTHLPTPQTNHHTRDGPWSMALLRPPQHNHHSAYISNWYCPYLDHSSHSSCIMPCVYPTNHLALVVKNLPEFARVHKCGV